MVFRTFLCALVAAVLLLLSLPMLLAAWILGKIDPRKKDVFCYYVAKIALSILIFFTGVRMKVIGKENVPKDRPVLFIGNHRSIFDIILTYPRCYGPVSYLAKIELSKIPLISTWMRNLKCLFVDRKDLRQGAESIFTAIDFVKNGEASVFIYPEGTRNKNASETDLMEFKGGSMKVAQRTGCPIIPVAMTNTADIFEAHFPWIKGASVILEYGKPIDPTTLSREEQKRLGETTRAVMIEMLEKHQTMVKRK